MRLDYYLISFVIFSLFVTGGLLVVNDLSNNYNVDINTSEYNNTFNKIDELYNIQDDIKTDTLDSELRDDDEAWESMTKGSYSAVKNVKATFDINKDLITDLADLFNVPSFIIDFIIVGLTIAILFGIIYLFLRYKP